MLEHNNCSIRPPSQNRELSDGKCGAIIKCVTSSNKGRMMETKTYRRTTYCSLPPDVPARNYDEQLKKKLMDLTPRNRARETSEGVQEFIKHVSDIIEKKNPFKESAVCSWPKGNKRNAHSPVIDSIQFNGVSKKSQEREKEDLGSETNYQIDVDEINKKLMRRLKYRGKLNSVPKKESRGKTNRPKSSTKKREQKDKKHERDTSLQSLAVESKPIKYASPRKEGQDVTLPKKPPHDQDGVPVTPSQNRRRRGRPSEIPLRKGRTDLPGKSKPVTMPLEKPLKEVERKTSVGFRSSPVRKDYGCTELHMTINVDLSSEKISIIGEEIEAPVPGLLREGTNCSIKPERYSKSPNTPVESLEDDSSTEKESNLTDLERVKTSSFTVLRNNSIVLNRLESLHKKNIHSKDKSGKGTLQLALTPKSSFNTLKGKLSKKNLLSCLSGKVNKPGLKMKNKKAVKEGNGERTIMQKKSKSSAESPRPVREETKENGKARGLSRSRKIGDPSNECFNVRKTMTDNSRLQKVKSSRGRSTPRRVATPRDEEETILEKPEVEPFVSGLDLDDQKLKGLICVRKPLLRKVSSEQSIISKSIGKEKERTYYLDSGMEIPMNPPPTPVNSNDCDSPLMEKHAEEEEDDQWSSKTITIDDEFNNRHYPWRSIEMSSETIAGRKENSSKETAETEKQLSLVVKDTSLNPGKDEPPEGLDSPCVKRKLKIHLRAHEADSKLAEKSNEREPAINVLDVEDSCKEELIVAKTGFSDTENGESKEGENQQNTNGHSVLFSTEVTNESGSLSVVLQKSCSSLKRKSQSKSGGCMKATRRKKIRSDAGDRQVSSNSVGFNSDMTLQNKNKLDAKVRSGLTKSSKREEKSDVFEDSAALKLKRRSSEPISSRGFVWKCVDSATPKDHKASVSSLTSSLRHLNTDEIDDFIFWEALPQKMTSCWEMSLYHFKRPWSVLSCSVFKDNRESSTPGLILENLRNGGTPSARRFAVNRNEREAFHKANPFDVEPSIAQKNIDIRNWLAALNFPTLPSTSNDAFSEGNFTPQNAIDEQNFNKSQASPKRRKVVPNLKFSDEASNKKSEENKYRKTTNWCPEEGLTDLVRRKSGGFVTCEQFFKSDQATHRPNVTVNFCVYSKSAEESILVETSDRTSVCEPRKYKSVEITTQPELSISATIISSGPVVGDQLIETTKKKEKLPQKLEADTRKNSTSSIGGYNAGNIPNGETVPISQNINIWKYLFIITILTILMHYCYVNSYMCLN